MINFQNVESGLLFALSHITQLENSATSFEDAGRAKQFINILDSLRNVIGAEIEAQGRAETL